jgi:hypothetical protein
MRADCWDLALLHFVDVRNRTPNARTGIQSPHQIITKEVLDFHTQFKFAFGDVLAVSPPDHEWKFDTNNIVGIYCGQPTEKHGALVYSPLEHSTLVRYNCWRILIPESKLLMHLYQRLPFKTTEFPIQRLANSFFDFQQRLIGDPDIVAQWYRELRPLNSSLFDAPADLPSANSTPAPTAVPTPSNAPRRQTTTARPHAPPAPPTRRSARLQLSPQLAAYVNHLEDSYEDDDPLFIASIQALVHSFAAVSKLTVNKVLKGNNYSQWVDAILLEVQQLIASGTLVAVNYSELPLNTAIIHSTMQLKEKLHQDGSVDKLKARLCACGNELLGVILDTFSPTVGALSYATVQQLAVIDQLHSCSIDVVGAYLYQDYPDSAPPLALQLSDNIATLCGYPPGQLFRINKYLYGLPDAGRAYYKAYSSHLIDCGFTRTASDPCLFVRLNGQLRTYISLLPRGRYLCVLHPLRRALQSAIRYTSTLHHHRQ